MKNPKIAEKLKEYRKINHLSVDEVAAYLREKNIDVATKTIYGWENGQTQPSADNLMHLCRFYNIQNVLNDMLANIQFLKNNSEISGEMMAAVSNLPTSGVRMAIASAVAIPVLAVFPCFERYFVKGIVIGGVKE